MVLSNKKSNASKLTGQWRVFVFVIFAVIVFGGFLVIPQYTLAQEEYSCASVANTEGDRLCGGAPYASEDLCEAARTGGSCGGICVRTSTCEDLQDAYDQTEAGRPTNTEVLASAVDTAITWSVGKVLEGVIAVIQFINSMLVILISWVAQLLDAAINLSLAGLSGIDAIQIGWEIVRDVANLFFIFALLVIAIATILRLEQYGAKALLARLIIIALLINFSLVIAAGVVDASNILALAFIRQIHNEQYSVSDHIATILNIGALKDVDEDSKAHNPVPPDALISKGAVTFYEMHDMNFTKDAEVLTGARFGTAPNVYDKFVAQFFFQVTILILELVLIFVFLSLAVMLLIRSVALIVIFVLAPLGFLAGVFPQTRGFSTQWWQKLFSWSFFFPAMAFMIYLAVTYGAQMIKLFPPGGTPMMNVAILFNYFVTVALLIGALLVARQMGIIGASAAIGLGLGMARRARGYAGRVGKAGLGGAASVTGLRATGRKIGDAAGNVLESRLGKIPGLRGGFSRISAGREKAAQEEAKRYAHLSPQAVANMSGGLTGMSAAAAAQAFSKMKPEDQRKFADTKGDAFESFAKTANQYGVKKSTLAKASGDIHQAMRILHSNEFGDRTREPAPRDRAYASYQRRVTDYLDKFTSKEFENLSENTVRNSDALRNYMFKNSANLKEVTSKRENLTAFSENMRRYMHQAGLTPNSVAQEVELKWKNDNLARMLRTNVGVNIILHPEEARIGTKRGQVRQVTVDEE